MNSDHEGHDIGEEHDISKEKATIAAIIGAISVFHGVVQPVPQNSLFTQVQIDTVVNFCQARDAHSSQIAEIHEDPHIHSDVIAKPVPVWNPVTSQLTAPPEFQSRDSQGWQLELVRDTPREALIHAFLWYEDNSHRQGRPVLFITTNISDNERQEVRAIMALNRWPIGLNPSVRTVDQLTSDDQRRMANDFTSSETYEWYMKRQAEMCGTVEGTHHDGPMDGFHVRRKKWPQLRPYPIQIYNHKPPYELLYWDNPSFLLNQNTDVNLQIDALNALSDALTAPRKLVDAQSELTDRFVQALISTNKHVVQELQAQGKTIGVKNAASAALLLMP